MGTGRGRIARYLRVIERHTRDYHAFDIYTRSLQQYFSGHEETATEWEQITSRIYPVLAKYQADGYGTLIKRANKYGGAFLCDGVGLGKTFIGLMLIERFVRHENKNVALFVPKAAKGLSGSESFRSACLTCSRATAV